MRQGDPPEGRGPGGYVAFPTLVVVPAARPCLTNGTAAEAERAQRGRSRTSSKPAKRSVGRPGQTQHSQGSLTRDCFRGSTLQKKTDM